MASYSPRSKVLERKPPRASSQRWADPARFHSARALASYVGVIPRVHQSGKRKFSSLAKVPLGNARLRRALWMPAITAIHHNAWLQAYYQHLRTAGKRPSVALVAVIRKLMTAVYSVAKHRRPFVLPSTFTRGVR